LALCVLSILRRLSRECQAEVTLTGEVQVALRADTWTEMPDSPLTRVARATTKARRAEDAVRAARAELRAAIVAAREAGESLSAIARVVGVTRQRIKQIIGR
jgi:DNA-directed RNA polymerase specialized sigma24 family protein